MMEIIRNERGGSKLCFEGYMYMKKYASANRVRWECSQRRAYSCSGGVSTDIEVLFNTFLTLSLSKSHVH